VARSLLAALARRKPAEAVREDLRRLKQILEMGVVARTTAVLSRP
jgi:hypothetical protein